MTEKGYLVLADISGYTAYLASTEIEHSQEILKALIDTIIDSMESVFKVAEVEGDAVFAYGPRDGITRAESVIENIETTYAKFIKHREVMKYEVKCDCRACSEVGTLDLKIISHYGEYALQDFGKVPKPFGSDVNLAHRLLKNSVRNATGWRGYALFSTTCTELPLPPDDKILRLKEHYDDFNELETLSYDLSGTYDAYINTHRRFISDADADYYFTIVLEIPIGTAWEWLVEPDKRNLWMTDVKWSEGKRVTGRTAVGSSNHCAHGKGKNTETIIDWKPFEYMTVESVEKKDVAYFTYSIKEEGEKTRVTFAVKMEMKLPAFIKKRLITFMMNKKYRMPEIIRSIEKLAKEHALS